MSTKVAPASTLEETGATKANQGREAKTVNENAVKAKKAWDLPIPEGSDKNKRGISSLKRAGTLQKFQAMATGKQTDRAKQTVNSSVPSKNVWKSESLDEASPLKRYINAHEELFKLAENYTQESTIEIFRSFLTVADEYDPFKNIRYVRVEHVNQAIHIQEIEVFDRKGDNIVMNNKNVLVQTSSSEPGTGQNTKMVINGNKDERQEWPCGCHTLSGADEWVQLDLGRNVDISRIVVWNRPDGDSKVRNALKNAHLKCLKDNRDESVTFKLSSERCQTVGHLTNDSGLTPLHVLAMHGGEDDVHVDVKLMKYIQDSSHGRAAMALSGGEGGTPLLFALSMKAKKEIIQTLLTKESVQVDVPVYNYTPLHIAYLNDEITVQMIEVITSLRPEQVAIRTSEGELPHQLFLEGNLGNADNDTNLELLEYVIKQLPPDTISKLSENSGRLPLHDAIINGCKKEILERFVNKKNPRELITATRKTNNLPLHVALQSENNADLVQEQVNFLLATKKEFVAKQLAHKNSRGHLPMHLAMMGNFSPKWVQWIVESTLAAKVDYEIFPPFPAKLEPQIGDIVWLNEAHKGFPNRVPLRIYSGPDRTKDYKLKDFISGKLHRHYIEQRKLQQYLAGGTILHAVLDMQQFDQDFFVTLLNDKKHSLWLGIKNCFDELPIDVAKRCDRSVNDVILPLWKRMAGTEQSVLNALRWGLLKEAVTLLESKSRSKQMTENETNYGAALRMSIRLPSSDALKQVQTKLVSVCPNVLTTVPVDFKDRRLIHDLAMKLPGTRKLPDILVRNTQGNSVHKNVRKWYNKADLSLVWGDPAFTKIKQPGNVTHCRNFSTWGFRGYLFNRGKCYYEVTVERKGWCPQIGWADERFEVNHHSTDDGVGDSDHSWGVDGVRKGKNSQKRGKLWHKGPVPWNEPLSWNDGDVVSFAIDLDSKVSTFSVAVNGNWENKRIVFENMKYKGGLWPAITHDGQYAINIGGPLQENKMKFPPPDDEYRTVFQEMQAQTRFDEVIAYAKEMVYDRCEIGVSECGIASRQKLLFMDGQKWTSKGPVYARLKATRMKKLPGYSIGEVFSVTQSDEGVLDINGYANAHIVPADLEVSIRGNVLHYLIADGANDIEHEIKVLLRCYGNACIDAKDDYQRTPLEIACLSGVSDLLKEEIFCKMQQQNLKIAMRAGLWKIVMRLLRKNKTPKYLEDEVHQKKSAKSDHAIHYAVKYHAPRNVLEKILEIDKKSISKRGKHGQTVLHDAIRVGSTKEDVEYLMKKESGDERGRGEKPSTLLEAADDDGLMPIHMAAACRRFELVKLLIKKGEEKKTPLNLREQEDSNDGWIPLHWACYVNEHYYRDEVSSEDCLGIIRELMNDKLGKSTTSGYEYIRLSERKTSSESLTPLHLAIMSNKAHKEVITELIGEACKSEEPREPRELDLAAKYITSPEILTVIANKFSDQITKSDRTNNKTVLHYAAEYNENPEILTTLIALEEEKKQNEKIKGDDSREHEYNVIKHDNDSMVPLHYAVASNVASLKSIKILVKAYNDAREKAGTGAKKLGNCGGADLWGKKKTPDAALPLHLSIVSDVTRSPKVYSEIIVYLMDLYPAAISQTKYAEAPILLALSTPNRLRSLHVDALTKMLDYYVADNDTSTKDIPPGVDLSAYFVENEHVFNTCRDDFVRLFNGQQKNRPTLGKKLPCRFPHLFKGAGLKKAIDQSLSEEGRELEMTIRRWKYWFVLHSSLFEAVEFMRIYGKDISCSGGLESLTKVVVESCSRDDILADYNAADTPMRNIVLAMDKLQETGARGYLPWLFEIFEVVDPINTITKAPKLAKKYNGHFLTDLRGKPWKYPCLSSPLAHAVRHGCRNAIVALSKGGCNPVKNAFCSSSNWNIKTYELASCAGQTLEGESENSRASWSVAMKAMRERHATDKYRSRNAWKRLIFMFSKLPMELLTIILMLFIGSHTTRRNNETVRFGTFLLDSIVDEPFRFEDSHVKKTFYDIGGVEDYHQWVEGPLLSALYTDNANSMHAEIGELSTLIGSIRIRQVRAKPQKCPNSLNLDEANFQRFKRKNGVVCMSDQVDFSFQTDSFGPGGKYKYYEPTSDLYERVIEGSRTWQYTYPRGGYIVELPSGNSTRAKQIIRELKSDDFVNPKHGTRLVLIEFSVFNGNIDRVASIRLLVEFWVGGGAQATPEINILEWEKPTEQNIMFLMTTALCIIFSIRGFFEIDEIAWSNLRSIAKQVEFGDASLGDSISTRVNVTSLRENGLTIGTYKWKPCCARARKNETKHTGDTSTASKAHQGMSAAPAYSMIENAFEQRENKQGAAVFMFFSDVVSTIHIELYVLFSFFLCFGFPLVLKLAGRRRTACCCSKAVTEVAPKPKNDAESIAMQHSPSKTKSRRASIKSRSVTRSHSLQTGLTRSRSHKNEEGLGSEAVAWAYSHIGVDNTYNGRPFAMWWQSFTRNDYFYEGWNYYEWVLVLLYSGYYVGVRYRDTYSETLRLTIKKVLDENSETFVPLDRYSYMVSLCQQLIAIIFIFVCIHLLRIMQEVPYGVGARVMAILKVIPHKDIRPFYITLLIMLSSFAIGIHFAYANTVVSYRLLSGSFLNVFFASFGDFGIGIEEMMDSTEIITFVIIITLILLISLIMMNIFIGVVGVVYEGTQADALLLFDEELDRYARVSLLSQESRKWAQKSLFPTFQSNLLSDSIDPGDRNMSATSTSVARLLGENRSLQKTNHEQLLRLLEKVVNEVKKSSL